MKFDKFFEVGLFVVLFLVLFRFFVRLFVVKSGFLFFFLLFLFVLFFVLLLFFKGFLFSFFSCFVSWFDGLDKKSKHLLVAIFFVLLFFLFIFFRTDKLSWDSRSLLFSLENRFVGSPYVLNNLFFIFVDFCLSFFGFSSVVTFLVVDAFCGVLFIYVSFLLASRLFRGEKRFLFFLMFLAVGSFKIFFGDVEVYAPVVVLLLVFIYFSVEYLLGRRSVLFPGFSFVLLFLFHVHAVFFLPTLVILPFLKNNFFRKKVFVFKELFLLFKVFVLPVLFFVILFSPRMFEIDNKFISPVKYYGFNESQGFINVHYLICPYCFCEKPLFCGSPELPILTIVKQNNVLLKQYGLFDFSHIKDWFNSIILIGPVFFLMLFVLFKVMQKLYLKDFYRDSLLVFFSFCLPLLLFRVFVMNYTSIMWDWDSLVLFGPIISLWTGYVCLKYFRFDKDLLIYVFWSLFAIGVCVVRDVLFII